MTDYKPELLPTPAFGNTAPYQSMGGCAWLNESTVAVMHSVYVQPAARLQEILVLDLETSDVRSFREHNEFTSSRSVLPVPGRDLLISQFHHFAEYPDPIGDNTTPEVVDNQTGARAPILTTEDRVVAAVSADLLRPSAP